MELQYIANIYVAWRKTVRIDRIVSFYHLTVGAKGVMLTTQTLASWSLVTVLKSESTVSAVILAGKESVAQLSFNFSNSACLL